MNDAMLEKFGNDASASVNLNVRLEMRNASMSAAERRAVTKSFIAAAQQLANRMLLMDEGSKITVEAFRRSSRYGQYTLTLQEDTDG